MAKSLRSKRKRKMRAIKRVRYGEKELKKLKEMLEQPNESVDVVQFNKPSNNNLEKTDDPMIGDQSTKYNAKTFRDKDGNYPIWMHPRKVTKLRRKHINQKKAKNKKR